LKDRERQTALYHAEIIQHRKELELAILKATETLIDLPSDATADPTNPSLEDSKNFRSFIAPFQPSDYDGLIQERNIEGKCGYCLCPQPRILQNTRAQFRILRVGKHDRGLKIVPRETLERWCSETCQRRALYVRVQLSEEPAWMREAMSTEISLLDESTKRERCVGDVSIVSKLPSSHVRDGREHMAREMNVGFEDVEIKENFRTDMLATPPSLEGGSCNSEHMLVEGYLPKDHWDKEKQGEDDGFFD